MTRTTKLPFNKKKKNFYRQFLPIKDCLSKKRKYKKEKKTDIIKIAKKRPPESYTYMQYTKIS